MPSSIRVTTTLTLQDDGSLTLKLGPSLSLEGDHTKLLTALLFERPGPPKSFDKRAASSTSEKSAATAGVPTASAAIKIRGAMAPTPGVDHSTVRRMVDRGELLATRGSRREILVPLWQLDRSGRPPRRLRDVLALVDKQSRHDPAVVEWFDAAKLVKSCERPIDLLLRDDEAGVTEVVTAFATYVARRA